MTLATPADSREPERLAALAQLEILDSLPERAYDDLVSIATNLCRTPTALVSFIDKDRQWFKAKVGLSITETPRDVSFCAHAILTGGSALIVEDALRDSRFASNPLVTGGPKIRFYAGIPFASGDGHALGTVCVIDTEPRKLDDSQLAGLEALARHASLLLSIRAQGIAAERKATAMKKDAHREGELLELVLQGADLGVWDLDIPTGAWTINAREREMLGYAESEATSDRLDWKGLIHPEDWPSVITAMNLHLSGAKPSYECTHRLQHKAGGWVWVAARAVVADRDTKNRPLRIVGTHRDITESKRVEDERRRNMERIELALAGGDLGLWDLDVADGRAVYNAQWWAMFGYLPDELATVDGLWKSMVHPDDWARAKHDLDRHMRGETPLYEGEVRMRHKDGEWLWIQDRAKVVQRTENGTPVRVVGVNMNITARKHSEQALQAATELLARTGSLAKVGGWELDARDMRVTWSDEVFRIHDLEPGLVPDLDTAIAYYPPESRSAVEASVRAGLQYGTPWNFELQMVTALGRRIWVRSIGEAEYDDGKVVRLRGAFQDITDRIKARLALVKEQQRLRLITDNLPVLIAELGPDRTIQFCNATYADWLGLSSEQMLGQLADDVLGSLYDQRRHDSLTQAYAGTRATLEALVLVDSRERVLHTEFIPQFNEDATVKSVIVLTSDVTELKEQQKQLDALARKDSLTGLANRRHFEERVEEALARTRRSGTPLAVMYLDIDKFKAVNDALGHAGGDQVLKVFARRLMQNIRETDLVARYAGDEFVILLEGLQGEAEAALVGSKILASMENPIQIGTDARQVTTSIGLAMYLGQHVTMAEVLAQADAALYLAKAAGRNCLRFAQ